MICFLVCCKIQQMHIVHQQKTLKLNARRISESFFFSFSHSIDSEKISLSFAANESELNLHYATISFLFLQKISLSMPSSKTGF